MMTCGSFGPQVLPIIPGNAARQSCSESGGELILEEEETGADKTNHIIGGTKTQ